MKKRLFCVVLALSLTLSLVTGAAGALSHPQLASLYEAADRAYETEELGSYKYRYALDSEGIADMDEIYGLLVNTHGLTRGGACGILSNMMAESNFQCDAVSGSYKGLCQWSSSRYSKLVDWCNSNGYKPVSNAGQVAYLVHELKTEYSSIASSILYAEDSASGAYNAAYTFCLKVERPSNAESRSQQRGRMARDLMYEVYRQVSEGGTFTDVAPGRYSFDAVEWAADEGITSGMTPTTFAPTAYCTRGQVITFLWNLHGCPETGSVSTAFVDVSSGAYYAKAVAWGVKNGVCSGMDASHFSPDTVVTRAQMVTFLWNAYGQPNWGSGHGFADVSRTAYYSKAVTWAQATGVTSGVGVGLFAPDSTCTREQAVTLLYNLYA